MQHVKIIVLAGMCLLFMASVGFTQGMMGGYGGQGGMNWDNGPYSQIPADKRGAYEEIYKKYQAQMWKNHEQMWNKQTELNAALAAPNVDEKRAEQLSNEIAKLMTENHTLMTRMQTEMRKAGIPYGSYMMGPGMMGGYGGYGRGGYGGMMGGYGGMMW